MKTITLTVVKYNKEVFFSNDNILLGFESLDAVDLLDMLEIPQDRESVEFDVVIAVKRPKPDKVVDILNLTEEEKFRYYEELDKYYRDGELIFKDKLQNKNGTVSIKCDSLGLITDIASVEKYFKLKNV